MDDRLVGFDGIELQAALQALDLYYICRIAKNTELYQDDLLFWFNDVCLRPGIRAAFPMFGLCRKALAR